MAVIETRKFVFAGNRFYVLNEMLKAGISNIKIYAVKNSFLEKELESRKISYAVLPEKSIFLKELERIDFDIFVSNGCPYIIPVSRLSGSGKKFVNVHPSMLPDLKGRNPVNGALLFERKHGVTCHYMDDGIDTGAVIEQLEIPVTDDVNLDLLYQLSFRAEGIVFQKAYENNFRTGTVQEHSWESVYYTRKETDRRIMPDDSVQVILRKVRAFGSENQYAYFIRNNKERTEAVSAIEIKNEMAQCLFQSGSHNTIKAVYGGRFVLAEFDGRLIQFQVNGSCRFKPGEMLIQ